MDVPPLLFACLLAGVGYGAALLAWPTRTMRPRARAVILMLIALLVFALPFALPLEPLGWKVITTFGCMTFACKLLDLHMGVKDWQTRSFITWAIFLPNPFVLVYRRHVSRPAHPRLHSLGLMLRGVLEIIGGVALIFGAYRFHAWEISFWLDHTVKVLGAYLCGYDGMFIFMTGFLRFFGCNVQDLGRNPIWSATPAEFWRRYNCAANEYLYENIFKPLGGVQRPMFGIVAVFLANGLLHEYLFTSFVGCVLGYQVVFFTIQAVAVLLTFRLRPRGLWRPVGRILTFTFNIVAVVLISMSIDIMVHGGWYGDWKSGFEFKPPTLCSPASMTDAPEPAESRVIQPSLEE